MGRHFSKKDASKSSPGTKENQVPDLGRMMKPVNEVNRDDAKTAYLQMGQCKPFGHKVPQGKSQSRGFFESWFGQFDWLQYNVHKDAAYRFYCYLFKPQKTSNMGNGTFTKEGFKNWKDTNDAFKEHAQAIDGFHSNARKHALDFNDQRQSVQHVWTVTSVADEEAYKARLTTMLGIARLLLLKALAVSGHDESKTSENKGNFREMLEWYIKKDPKAALVTGENAPGDNLMSFPIVQKDLVRASAEEASEVTKSEIGYSHFGVLVDEAHDASIEEQMAMAVRFVNDEGNLIKKFLGIHHVPNTTSPSLKVALDAMPTRYGPSIFRIRGQGYDGASNIIGQFHGLQRLVLNENPSAFYIRCFAHQLQLVVVSVANCCGSTYDYFNHVTSIVDTVSAPCKRKDQLLQNHHERLVEQLDSGAIFARRGKNQESSLPRPGDTRWGTHHKTLTQLLSMWYSILEVLENISDDGADGEKRTTASGLIQTMESFEFVFILHLMIRILGKIQELSQCLQRENQNIVHAIGLIGSVMRYMNDMRENGWDSLFEEVKSICLKMNVEIPNMEDQIPIRGHSRCLSNRWVSYYHHFHHGIFNVVIDQILCELNNRFPERSIQLLRHVVCLDPRDSFTNFEVEKLIELAKIYVDDFSDYDCLRLLDEVPIFIHEVRNDNDFSTCIDLGNLAEKMVQTDRCTHFPLVCCLIELALIILKTEQRNKVNDDWMNISMISIERDLSASVED